MTRLSVILRTLLMAGDVSRPMAEHEPEFDMVEIESRAEEIASDTLLTEREAEVWLLQEVGLTRDSIGTELGVSIHTVDEYRKRRKKKLREAQATVETLG